MKKYLPFLFVIFFAVAGCNSKPATFELGNSKNFISNCETFVKNGEKTYKQIKTDEQWEDAMLNFRAMCKEYYIVKDSLSNEEDMKFQELRVRYVNAITKVGDEEKAMAFKGVFDDVKSSYKPY